MSTLRQQVYNVRNSNSAGRSHRALTASDRQIAFWIKCARNFLMYADASKKDEVSVGWEQDLGCVTLAKVDQADCPNKEWGEIVQKVSIPRVLDLQDNGGITFFGLIDKRTRIYLPNTNWGSLDDHMPYKKKKWYEAAMIGNAIYLYPSLTGEALHDSMAISTLKKLCVVNIRGIFEDPTEVTTCASEGVEAVCFDWDNDCYPIPPHIEPIMYKYIDDNYILSKAMLPQDTKNDELRQTIV